MHWFLHFLWVTWFIVGITRSQDVIFTNPSETNKSPGSPCTTKDGGQGQCTEILKCPGIRETLSTDPPVICGFKGISSIVCCPNAETTPGTPTLGTAPVLDISPPNSYKNFACGTVGRVTITTEFSRFKRSNELRINKRSIFGGIEARRAAWPWMALIGIKEEVGFNWFCGGVLINEQWVLTAAHCLDDKIPTIVRLGEHNYATASDGSNEEDFEISQMIRYPDYAFPVAYHDLALLQLKTKVNFKASIAPVCIPWGDESLTNLTGRSMKLTGWGDTQFAGSPSTALQEVNVNMISTSACHNAYSVLRQFKVHWPKGIGKETVCAGHEQGGRDACQGDSGGPLTYRGGQGKYFLSGIVSTGYGCGSKDFPGIYANVFHSPHLAWIKQVAF
ncbi:venom protease-like isoform X2 [Palaemon carinicauda]|uniref:venom protease-like isoform X2 n=1 Tax=Palaemon carinicauda TaxID=392227 RepID=UPI0035B58C8C